MASGQATYQEPGVVQSEIITPTGLNISALPFGVTLVGTGSRNKRVANEAVVRGAVLNEAVTPAGSSLHLAVLANRAVRTNGSTTVTKTLNGISTVVPSQYISFPAPYVLGTVTSTVDLSQATGTNAFGLRVDNVPSATLVLRFAPSYVAGSITFGAITGSTVTLTRASATFLLDGIKPGHTLTIANSEDTGNNGVYTVNSVLSATAITITKNSGSPVVITASPDTAMTLAFSGVGSVGRELTAFSAFSGSLGAAATITQIAAAVNAALQSAQGIALGFGNALATVDGTTGGLRVTSTNINSTADIKILAPAGQSALTAIFGAVRNAATYILIADAIWSTSASWVVTYAQRDSLQDPLSQTSNIQNIVSVGSTRNGTNFAAITDYKLTGALVDFNTETVAQIVGIAGPTFDISTNNMIVVTVDNFTANSTFQGTVSTDVLIQLTGMLNPPVGYVNAASAAVATTAEIRTNINAVLAAALGPFFDSVATATTIGGVNNVTLTSPTSGGAVSAIYVKTAPTTSATASLFGSTGTLKAFGVGKKPADGSTYFVSYDYTRPASDYNVPLAFFGVKEALAQVGLPSASTAGFNPLAIATNIAFANGANFVYTIQINDTAVGNPTRQQIQDALDGAGTLASTTEICLVDEPGTRLESVSDLIAHLEANCASTEKHYRRIHGGMASGTAIGDVDTANTLVYQASNTMQVSPSSPGRGRMFMNVPPQQAGLTRTETLDDGTTARLSLNATYIGVAFAAARTALSGPAETLTRKTIVGFDLDNITTPWKPAERRALAGQGCNVLAFQGGVLKFLDAKSTELSLTKFRVDSTSYCKDIVVSNVDKALDDNLVGIVPFDLPTFLLEIKLVIQGVLTAAMGAKVIGPYLDSSGAIRQIDLSTDIAVQRDVNTLTLFNFSYNFNGLYPALNFSGTYVVDGGIALSAASQA